jgi:hypothetical protein
MIFRSRPAHACTVLLCMAMIAACAQAAESDVATDDAALDLADRIPEAPQQARNWHLFAEGALGSDKLRDGRTQSNHRLSLDLQYDAAFAPGWRAVLSDRLDASWPPTNALTNEHAINTIKEAYLSWQAQANTILDLGRINVRNGVAVGYNPTDYFRAQAVRSSVSVDPNSLKINRQGSVMLRGQKLWNSGSITAIVSPRLANQASDSGNSGFNPNLGATNHENRWLIAVSQKITDRLSPQFLLYKPASLPAQLGFNLSGLVNDATVAYVEWSGGRSPSLLAQALDQQGIAHTDDSAFRNRLATGLTTTTANKISLTAEVQYNGGAQDNDSWTLMRNNPTPALGLYRNWLQQAQEPVTRWRTFAHLRWQDALINHLDLSALAYYNLADHSRLTWIEARYHWQRTELALQWQRYTGEALTEFGATPQLWSWQVVLRQYF